jgi:hypothetical protein
VSNENQVGKKKTRPVLARKSFFYPQKKWGVHHPNVVSTAQLLPTPLSARHCTFSKT